jgi:pyridoxamine 5'-phosphate oxidase
VLPGELRKEYTQRGLREEDINPDPIRQFQSWFDQAVAAQLDEPNAMTLATATPEGRPSARIVLLKGFDAQGFVFHTNYQGRKGQELASNPWAALLFFWRELERQVRIEGAVEVLPASESDAYFRTRPVGSRIGAWASPQSEVIADRVELEQRVRQKEQEFLGQEVPRPPFWGGFRVRPVTIEFWQGRPNRLHDRLRYRRVLPEGWRIERLAP